MKSVFMNAKPQYWIGLRRGRRVTAITNCCGSIKSNDTGAAGMFVRFASVPHIPLLSRGGRVHGSSLANAPFLRRHFAVLPASLCLQKLGEF